jgi:hypothetical protein
MATQIYTHVSYERKQDVVKRVFEDKKPMPAPKPEFQAIPQVNMIASDTDEKQMMFLMMKMMAGMVKQNSPEQMAQK